MFEEVIWDLPDNPEGNYRRIIDNHDVTAEEVEEILRDPDSEQTFSRSSGRPIVYGWTSTGKFVAVVYEEVHGDPLSVYPIVAFIVPPLEG